MDEQMCQNVYVVLCRVSDENYQENSFKKEPVVAVALKKHVR